MNHDGQKENKCEISFKNFGWISALKRRKINSHRNAGNKTSPPKQSVLENNFN